MELSSITNRIWIFILLLIACLGVGYFFTLSTYNNYQTEKQLLHQSQQRNGTLEQGKNRLEQFLGSYEERKADKSILDRALPVGNADIPNILAGIGDLAASSGVSLTTFQIDEPVTTEGVPPNTIQTVIVNLGGGATYASFEDFIVRLEQHLRIMDIQRINLVSQEGGIMQYQLSLKTYFQK